MENSPKDKISTGLTGRKLSAISGEPEAISLLTLGWRLS